MAATEFGIVYAVLIITVQFGSVVSKVCECLLRRGPLSSRDISHLAESDISHNQLKDILYLLIQHNCVQAFSVEPPYGSESKATVEYIVLFNNILHRVRYNKFLRVVNEELNEELNKVLGKQCGKVLDWLLCNGRLTLGQLIERDEDSRNLIGPEVISDSLQKLVAAHFIELIPSPERFLETKKGRLQRKKVLKLPR